MARVLILSLIFRPDNVSTAQIMGDLALDLKARGHEIYVISTVPHYNGDDKALARQPLRPFCGKLIQKSDYFGVRVLHVWMPDKDSGNVIRVFAWAGFHVASTMMGIFSRFRPDVILAPSPPLTITLSAWFLSRWFRAPFVYNIQEVYPDVAVDLGILRSPLLIKLLQRIERFAYARAAALTVISEGMASRIRPRVSHQEKIRVIPNFVDTSDFHPLDKKNDFSRKHGLDDKFVVSYAGNMGKPQGLEILIEAAGLLHELSEIHFLMMGDGSEAKSLMEQAELLKLTNVTFLPYQPYSVMPEAYASVDASFVPQAPGTSDDGIPSKVYRIMACGRPVIACTEMDSDLARLVIKSGGGAVVPSGNAEALADAIRKAFQQRTAWLEKGLKARNLVLQEYSRAKVSDGYHQLLMELQPKRNGEAGRP